MTFQPALPLGGYAGWRFLSASLENQTERFAKSPLQARDMSYFRENIGKVTSAEDLVQDYRLLRVALGAYGLQDDLPNKAFVERVLSDGVTNDDALSNRLADKRYRRFSEAFGFGGPLPPKTKSPGFADRMLARFERQEFERAVGEQDQDMRLALTAAREVGALAEEAGTDTAAWLGVLGNPPLRKVFETAFGLPSSIGTVDLDQQVDAFRIGAERVTGTPDFAAFRDPDKVEDLIRAFTIRAQIANGPSPFTPGIAALTLLQNV